MLEEGLAFSLGKACSCNFNIELSMIAAYDYLCMGYTKTCTSIR